MATITTQAGPWNMTVYSFDEGDPQNPLGRISAEDVARIPFGAAELDRDGRIVSFNDTEPEDGTGPRGGIVGRNFFDEAARWAAGSVVAEEFHRGVAAGELNTVFDCASARVGCKVRVHLKISPILGTYWVFIKRLRRLQ